MRRLALSLVALLFACGDDGGSEPDGGPGDASAACSRAADCDDGLFCNGEERCAPEASEADARGCVGGVPPCDDGTRCDEGTDRCASCAENADGDGDGVDAIACGGEDCDDDDPNRYPGAAEICDPVGIDEDCDPTTLAGEGQGDGDLDGFLSDRCCNRVDGELRCGPDCDDRRGSASPEAAELCNTSDDDCDGRGDEGVTTTYVVDADGDGFGSAAEDAERVQACGRPEGFREDASDCDDGAAGVNPAAFDRCDPEAVDDDCNGTPNDPPGGCECTDGASRPCPRFGACAASTQTCVSGLWGDCGVMPVEEVCGNAIDDDCDGEVDERCPCRTSVRFCGTDVGACERGVQACLGDGSWGPCVDSVGPVVELACDGVDEDCDGVIDEGTGTLCYPDADGDGYATAFATARVLCSGGSCAANETSRPPREGEQDCDDNEPNAYPGQTAYFATPRRGLGGYDYDCDGAIQRVHPDSVLPCFGDFGDFTACMSNPTGLDAIPPCGVNGDLAVCAPMMMGSSGSICTRQVIDRGVLAPTRCR